MNPQTSGVIVTGGASGLGKATALLLAEAGRPVAIWDLNAEGAKSVAARCSAADVASVGVGVDVGSREAVIEAAIASRKAIGPVGGLACCAAITRIGPVGHINFADWDLTMSTNLNGIAYAIEALLPALREVGAGAAIVVIASTEALRGNANIAAYTASKHGALGLVRSAARTLGPERIRVNAICPGAMKTPMLAGALKHTPAGTEEQMLASIPLGYASDPKEVGYVVRFLLSEEASYVTGVGIPVDGGMTA